MKNVIIKITLIIALFVFSNQGLLSKKIIIHRDTVTPKTTFILSGGGARGVSQIGILKRFESYGITPDYIVGTSIGAIIGGLYASGYNSAEIIEIIDNADWKDIFALSESKDREDLFLDQKLENDKYLFDLRFNNFKFDIPRSISLGNKFNLFLKELFWDATFHPRSNFDQLKIPFRAVATDLVSGTSVPLDSGNISTVIRASTTIPLRYSPVAIDSGLYVDGGILSNIPIEHTHEFDSDIEIVFNSTSELLKQEELNVPWNIADQSISVAMKVFENIALDKADIVIAPELDRHRNSDFTNLEFLVARGYNQSQQQIKSYIKLKDSLLTSNIRNYFAHLNMNDKYQIQYENLTNADSIYYESGTLELNDFIAILKKLIESNYYHSFKIEIGNKKIKIIGDQIAKLRQIKFENDVPGYINRTISIFMDNNYERPLTRNLIKEFEEKINRRFRLEENSYGGIIDYYTSDDTLFVKISDGIIDGIVIESKEGTRDFLVLRELGFKRGDPINSKMLSKGWMNLLSSQLFSEINIEPTFINPDSLIIRIFTEEVPQQSIKIGGRVDNEWNGQIAIKLKQQNLLNLGADLSFGFTGGNNNQNYEARLGNRRIFSSMIFANISGYYLKRDFYEYFNDNDLQRDRFSLTRERNFREQRYGSILTLGSQISRSGILYSNLRYEKQRIYNLDTIIKDPFITINTLKFAADFDTRDDNSFATKGSKLILSLESNVFRSEGTEGFSKALFSYEYFTSIGKHTILPKLFFGAADKTLPNVEFFSLGGEDSFYGFREEQSRGRQKFLGSLGYRYKIPIKLLFDTYFSLRYDLGTTWTVPEQIKFSGLMHGVGTRLSWATPVGAATFSVGRAFRFLNDPPTVSWGDTLLYFSIGMDI